ncbi:hypothetical protein RvY_16068 [Ramazzottius varieornatus]|uniref:Uncharacterized protein n=1 Tax=Ramazzottius varieornatus TaxID=947166 RepID=A0A1D1W1N7_RAMVA|nr:hypothetical protein RvY_16068 [Ramazzottius varieornatus]
MATAIQQSPLTTERFERTTFAEPAHVRIETTTTTTVISRDINREGGQYYTIPKGYPGGNVSHNPPIVRVVQKPIEALNVDGDNPFRPEGELYKEAEEVVKAYTLPRGSGAPSPLPGEHPESPNQNDPIHTGETTAVSNAGINLSSPSRSRVTSSTESSQSAGPAAVNLPQPSDSQSGTDHVEKPSTARRKSSTDVQVNHKRQSNPDNNVQPDAKKKDRKEKKKKKPVGCGGDKRCSIM